MHINATHIYRMHIYSAVNRLGFQTASPTFFIKLELNCKQCKTNSITPYACCYITSVKSGLSKFHESW